MDVLLTQEGRRQLASGDMRINYVSFTDAGTYYRGDVSSGSADATNRIFFEACNLPQDQVTFEANDAGKLEPFGNSNDVTIKNGQVFSYLLSQVTASFLTGSLDNVSIVSGEEFASTADLLLASSIDNFRKNQLIASRDPVFEDDGFGLGNSNVTFTITSERPISNHTMQVVNLDHLDSLFSDARFSRTRNFAFLPPINRVQDSSINKSDHRETSARQLGNYVPLGVSPANKLTYQQVSHELRYYEDLGFMRTITFDPTSRNNTIFAQFFERSHDTLKKLDVVDFGQHVTGNPILPLAHVFFVGKIMTDNNNTHTFIHLFTLVFE